MQASAQTIHEASGYNGQTDAPSSVAGDNSLLEIIVVLGFSALFVWGGHMLMSPATLPVKQVRIEGDFQNLSTRALQDLIRNEVKGGFFNVNVSAIRNALLKEPWVNDVSVHRVWPDSLQVYVDEQVAVTRWNDDGLLNRRGSLFRPDKNTIPANLPLLEGPELSQAAMLEKFYYLNERLESVNLSVAKLSLDDRRSWKFITADGLTVILGKNNFNDRVERFVNQAIPGLGEKINETGQIDMRYPNGFAVRWKNATAGQQESGAL